MTELLDFSKIIERDTIKLPDGKAHELINRADLGVYEYQQLRALQNTVAKLTEAAEKGPLSKPKEKELLDVLGTFVKVLIPTITPGVLARLRRANREQIILAWLSSQFTEKELAGLGGAQSRRTTAASSRGSKRSTAATRSGGSTSRRGR